MDKVLLISGIFCLAMILRATGTINETFLDRLVRFVVTATLPCLTVSVIGKLDLEHAHFDIAVIAWLVMLVGTALSYGIGRLIGLQEKKLRVFILVSTFPNTAFLGYPLTYALFGNTGLSYAVIYDQMGMFPLFLSLGFFIAGGMESIIQSLKFPPFLALLAALSINLAGISLPGPIGTAVEWIGWTTLPLTILLIGAKIRLTALSDIKPITVSLLLKMVIIPALLYTALRSLGKIDLPPYQVALLETAMPPALITSIIALRFGLDDDLAIACISAGTLLCMAIFTIATLFS